MTLWNVMDHLTDGPSPGTIRRIELRGVEPGDRGSQSRRRFGDLGNPLIALDMSDPRSGREGKFPDGKPQGIG